MFDEPEEDPAERSFNPTDRARDKSDEFRMHAELCAVFEGVRKFDARLVPGLDAQIARDVQRGMARLGKAKTPESPIIPESSLQEAVALLNPPVDLSTNDYHIYRRPGEVMVIRWLAGDEVDAYYTRIQAHFDAVLTSYRDEQHTDLEWKQDTESTAYLAALDAIDIKMSERYLRPLIRQSGIAVLSDHTVDEMSILHLTNGIMAIDAADLVGAKSAPPDEPTEKDLAWFFKLFCLRGMGEGIEKMCFFAFLQKTEDEYEF